MSSTELAGLRRRIRSVRRSLRRQLDESQGSWSGLSASCVRQALLVYVWSQAKTPRHALDAAAAYLSRAAPLVIAQVAVSPKDAFSALLAATSAALIARLSTDPPAYELCQACDFIIQYLLHDWVRSQNVEYGVAPTRQQLVRQALHFVPDGLPEAVEKRVCLPFHGDPPSQRTYLKRFRKAWNRRIGTLPITVSLPIHVLQEKAWNWCRVGSVWYQLLRTILEPHFEVRMSQVNRVAPLLGVHFWYPFLGAIFEAIFCFGFCKPGLFFLPVGQLHPAREYFGQHG